MQRTREKLVVALALAGLTLLTYAPVLGNGFVNYDDDLYILDSPPVRAGLEPETVRWAFTTLRGANWFPLTWLSWAADAELYGMEPAGFHATSALLHAAAAVLLYLAFARMTGAPWRSAVVAAVFAVHPLHVESVAWAAARKDVLSGVFAALALAGYAAHAARPSAGRMALVAAALAAGLLSKPTLVALPFALLLLDVWPLRRLRLPRLGGPPGIGLRRALTEKLPLFALAAASCAVTYYAQARGGTVQGFEEFPFAARVGNALVSIVAYAARSFWPTGLSVHYRHPGAALPAWQALAAGALLAAVTLAVLRELPRRPYLAVGWLWYVGMLVPVIGLVQVGSQARADRYTYLPQVGLSIAVVWGLADAVADRRSLRRAAAALAAAALVALGLLSAARVRVWRDSFTLFEDALRVDPDNHVAHINLGVALGDEERYDEAAAHLERALALAPRSPLAPGILAEVRRAQGRPSAAARLFRRALRRDPGSARWNAGLAGAQLDLEQPAKAVRSYRAALELDPSDARAIGNLGLALFHLGRTGEAVARYREALEARPDLASVRANLGIALLERGEDRAAVAELRRALEDGEDLPLVRAHLGRALLRSGRSEEGIAELERAARLDPEAAEYRALLAHALQEAGRGAEAAEQYRAALSLGARTPDALNNLAWLLVRGEARGDPADALPLALEAAEETEHRVPAVLETLALAYAAAGRDAEATATAGRALALAEEQGDRALAEALRRRWRGPGD